MVQATNTVDLIALLERKAGQRRSTEVAPFLCILHRTNDAVLSDLIEQGRTMAEQCALDALGAEEPKQR